MIKMREFQRQNLVRIEEWIANRIHDPNPRNRKVVLEYEPGVGKSTLAPIWLYRAKKLGYVDKICWVVPRTTLAEQAKESFFIPNLLDGNGDPVIPVGFQLLQVGLPEIDQFEIHYSRSLVNEPNPSKGLAGFVTTYNAIASDLDLYIREFREHRYLLFLDELQFAKLGARFGTDIERIQEFAAFTVIVSGDFDTIDNEKVALVDYQHLEGMNGHKLYVKTDDRYGYDQAYTEHAVAMIDFHYSDGPVGYKQLKDESDAIEFDWDSFDHMNEDETRKALQSIFGDYSHINREYAQKILTDCLNHWSTYRLTEIEREGRKYPPFPDAQMLIVTASIKNAEWVYRFLTEVYKFDKETVMVAHTQAEDPHGILDAFRHNRPYGTNRKPVQIAITVGMAYVGMDAPDATHLCLLTFVRSKPWIHQCLARIWRLYRPVHNRTWAETYCCVFAPQDSLLRKILDRIKNAQQIGWFEPLEREGNGSTPDERKRSVIIPTYAEIKYRWAQFSLSPDSVKEEIDLSDAEFTSLETVYNQLVTSGIPDDYLPAAMAAIEQEFRRERENPSAPRTYKDDRKQLEEDQKEVTRRLCRHFGWTYPEHKAQWIAAKTYVSKLLKDQFGGRGVGNLDHAEIQNAIDSIAPRIEQWCLENLDEVKDAINAMARTQKAF